MRTDAFDLGRAIGSAIRATRRESGWSQRELAARCGTTQPAISRLETGRSPHLDVRVASRTLDALGIRVRLDANSLGLADRREQRDAVHAASVAYVVRRLRRAGWEARAEVEVGDGRYRGWIDVLAYRHADHALFVAEVKTAIVDLGRTLRTVGWYGRAARQAALGAGWRPRVVTAALLVLCTVESDARLTAQHEALHAALQGTAPALAAWIDRPGLPGPGPTAAMFDPRSRRAAWILPSRSGGRRSRAPYLDYRDAAISLSGRSGRSSRP